MGMKFIQLIGALIISASIIIGCSDKSASTSVTTSKANSTTSTQMASTSVESTVSWSSLQPQVSQLSSLGKGADQKMEQSKQFVQTAMNQYQGGQTQAEVNNLTQAKTLADSAVLDITTANNVLDEIMKLKLSPIMLQYFQAKKRAGTALLSAEQIDLNGVNAILASHSAHPSSNFSVIIPAPSQQF